MVEPVDIQHITRAVAVSRSCSHDAPLCWHANLLPVRSEVLLLRTVISARYGSIQFHIKEVAHRSQRLFVSHGPLARTCQLGKWKVPRTSGTQPCAHSQKSWSPASRTEEIPMPSDWHLSRWSSPVIEVLRCSGFVTTESCRERAGDVCAIIFGTRSPFILRRVPTEKYHFHLIVATYILSKELNPARYLGAPCRLGDNGCEDWMEWGLPTQDIVLC